MLESQPFFDLAPVWASMPILLKGFAIAMLSATLGTILAAIVGLAVAIVRLGPAPFSWFAFAFTQLFRGVPLYVLIIWIYFGVAIAADVNIPAIPAGILTLALLNAGYLSETFRSGILAVDRGQREAGLAMGLSRFAVMRHVILPQATRIVIPPTGNQYVDAIKDSAILSIIGVPELMRETQQLADLYYRPFEFYTAAAVLYLIAVLLVARAFTALERRMSIQRLSTTTSNTTQNKLKGGHETAALSAEEKVNN